MPVNLVAPNPENLNPVPGIMLGVAKAGIRKSNRTDLLVLNLSAESCVAAAFTQNRFCAAPVIVAKKHLAENTDGVRALVINTGNANAGTGTQGLLAAQRTCQELAQLLRCHEIQVLPFSTGVIMEPLPLERLVAGLPACIADLREDNWFNAAQAIMTTDTCPKAISSQIEIAGKKITITGIAKGAGMIRPDMATMLGFIATDANVAQPQLQAMLDIIVQRSFNRISIDGDTSTNDAVILVASGRAGNAAITSIESAPGKQLLEAITAVAVWLAQAIVRDGEGATKFITVNVDQGANEDECKKVAYAIAHSPLVKTAFFASDPNLGRILAAIGYAGIADLDVAHVSMYLDDVLVVEAGSRSPGYVEHDAQMVMKKSDITIRILLGRGVTSTTVWTCDLSHDYVSINADYRS